MYVKRTDYAGKSELNYNNEVTIVDWRAESTFEKDLKIHNLFLDRIREQESLDVSLHSTHLKHIKKLQLLENATNWIILE